MDAELTQERLKSTLKAVLKKRGRTFADVAAVWGCSLPTVKRQLGREELPLTRLLSLLEWLEMSLADIEKLARSSDDEAKSFNAKQVEFLAGNPLAFAFLFKLQEADVTPALVAKKYGLSRKTVDQILFRLEKYDLIRTGPGRVRPLNARPLLSGELADLHLKMVMDRAGLYFRKHRGRHVPNKDLGVHIHMMASQMSEASHRQFQRRLSELANEMADVARFEEEKLPPTELRDAYAFLALSLDRPDSPDYALVADPFGEFLREPS